MPSRRIRETTGAALEIMIERGIDRVTNRGSIEAPSLTVTFRVEFDAFIADIHDTGSARLFSNEERLDERIILLTVNMQSKNVLDRYLFSTPLIVVFIVPAVLLMER